MVPEGRRIYPYMSVKDNLLMGAYLRSDKAGIRQDLERIYVRFPRVKERLRQQAGTLSGGEQEMVVVGRALMARPSCSCSTSPRSASRRWSCARSPSSSSRSTARTRSRVILVEQNSRMALKVCRRAYVLETGRVGLAGASAELANDDHVRRLYLGG